MPFNRYFMSKSPFSWTFASSSGILIIMNQGIDLLSDILKNSGMKRRVLSQRSFRSETHLPFPCEKSLGFHIVVQGKAYLHAVDKKEVIELSAGDIALMPRGSDHVVSTEPSLKGRAKSPQRSTSATPPLLTLVSGAYQFWNTPVHPFFSELPTWYVMRASELGRFDRLSILTSLLAEEIEKPDVGSQTITESLLDMIFSLIVRRILETKMSKPKTWGHALRDPQIRVVIEKMHSDVARDWSIDDFATAAGLSRSAFAQRFKDALGETPHKYLTAIRIQKAMELLCSTNEKIETIAEAVGYQDAFGFSKVFKKVAGVPPKEFRNRDRTESDAKYRFV